jgi:hypothetical protein
MSFLVEGLLVVYGVWRIVTARHDAQMILGGAAILLAVFMAATHWRV